MLIRQVISGLTMRKFISNSLISHKLRDFQRLPFLLPNRGIRTTESEHPDPIYDHEDRVLKKMLEERDDDLPLTMQKQKVVTEGAETGLNPYERPVKKCILCEYNITPDYKNVKLLSQFVSQFTGMVYPKNITGLCSKKQTELENAITFASDIGYMASYLKEVEFVKDPKICDPERPLKSHKY